MFLAKRIPARSAFAIARTGIVLGAGCALCLSAWLASTAHAQNLDVLPGAVQSNDQRTSEYYRRQQLLEEAKRLKDEAAVVDTAEPAPPPAEPPGGQAFEVRRIDVEASEILPEAEIESLISGYQNRFVTVAELIELTEKLNALYRQRGFITAKAILPPQKVSDGVVRIALIESRLDGVRVENNASTRGVYILNRLDYDLGALIELDRLEQELVAFNLRNDIRLRAQLEAGGLPETTTLVLNVDEPAKYSASFYADNAGRESVGQERVGLQLMNSSLLGYRDRVMLGGSYAEGTDTAFANYSFPVGGAGTRVGIAYDYSEVEIVSGPLEGFNVTGKSSIGSLYVAQPFITSWRRRLGASVGYNIKESETDFDSVDQFETSVRTVSTGLDYQQFGKASVLYVLAQWNAGLDSLGGDEDFHTLTLDVASLWQPAERHEFLTRARGQVTNVDNLPSSEQFQLGGVATIRGFGEGVLIGDQGYAVSGEYRYKAWQGRPVTRLGERENALRLNLFVDHGGVFTSASGTAPELREYLTSAGVGALFSTARRIQAQLQVGWPLGDDEFADDDYEIHFYLSYTPFE